MIKRYKSIAIVQPIMGVDTVVKEHVRQADARELSHFKALHAPKRKAMRHGLTGFVEYLQAFFN